MNTTTELNHDHRSSDEYNEKHSAKSVVVVGEGQTEGLAKVEAVQRVWYVNSSWILMTTLCRAHFFVVTTRGPKSRIAFWVGIALISYVYSLDGTYLFLHSNLPVFVDV